MKKETASGRGKVIVGGLFAALCAIVSLAISVPAMADVCMSSVGSPEETAEAQQPATGTLAGHEYVDLGLSVKWATCNVGASSPSEYGDYFAWGETTTKLKYTQINNITLNVNLGDIAGNPQYDAARANWGGSWRLPTKTESKELIENCNWVWTTYNGHNGYKVISKINGNSIFLPAAGLRSGSSLGYDSIGGYYWSSTPRESGMRYAFVIAFYDDSYIVNWYGRDDGRSVRPVTE